MPAPDLCAYFCVLWFHWLQTTFTGACTDPVSTDGRKAQEDSLGYKSRLPRLLLEFYFFHTLYSCICISHNMDSLQYGWSNMLPSPILYHAEPALSGLRIEPTEPPATAGPSVASYPFSMPDARMTRWRLSRLRLGVHLLSVPNVKRRTLGEDSVIRTGKNTGILCISSTW